VPKTSFSEIQNSKKKWVIYWMGAHPSMVLLGRGSLQLLPFRYNKYAADALFF